MDVEFSSIWGDCGCNRGGITIKHSSYQSLKVHKKIICASKVLFLELPLYQSLAEQQFSQTCRGITRKLLFHQGSISKFALISYVCSHLIFWRLRFCLRHMYTYIQFLQPLILLGIRKLISPQWAKCVVTDARSVMFLRRFNTDLYFMDDFVRYEFSMQWKKISLDYLSLAIY